jgi:hypothetical protein
MRNRAISDLWSRAMTRIGGRGMRGRLVLVAVALAAVGVGASSSEADQNGPGIWIYNCNWTASVVNFTNYTMTMPANNLAESGGCEPGQTGPVPFHDFRTLDPYRTWMEGYANGCNVTPIHYNSGCTTFEVSGFPELDFDVCFAGQDAHDLAEKGEWIYLKPHDASQGWTAPNSWGYGRWATPVNESPPMMHNIMTLIGPKLMVALYSTDNKSIVVVVQQHWENASGWDDSSKYKGLQLDFVDNAESSVPGQ